MVPSAAVYCTIGAPGPASALTCLSSAGSLDKSTCALSYASWTRRHASQAMSSHVGLVPSGSGLGGLRGMNIWLAGSFLRDFDGDSSKLLLGLEGEENGDESCRAFLAGDAVGAVGCLLLDGSAMMEVTFV